MKKPTILILDDEKEFTDSFAEFLLQRFNAKVIVRKNVEEGIKVLDKQSVDVLFQDMMMPGLGGETVVEHIKNLERINEMIIFVMSKWDLDTRIIRFEDCNVKYIPKPISMLTTQRILMEDFEIKGGFDYKKKRDNKSARETITLSALFIMLFLMPPLLVFASENPHENIFNEYINSPEGNSVIPADNKAVLNQVITNEVQEPPIKEDTKKSLRGIPGKDQVCGADSDCTSGVVNCDSWEPYNKKFSRELFKVMGSCPASIDPGFQPAAVCVAQRCQTTEKISDNSWDDWLDQKQ